jgi:hypothetical protein
VAWIQIRSTPFFYLSCIYVAIRFFGIWRYDGAALPITQINEGAKIPDYPSPDGIVDFDPWTVAYGSASSILLSNPYFSFFGNGWVVSFLTKDEKRAPRFFCDTLSGYAGNETAGVWSLSIYNNPKHAWGGCPRCRVFYGCLFHIYHP